MESKKELKKHTGKVDPKLFSQFSAVISRALYFEEKNQYVSNLCKSRALCIHDQPENYPFPGQRPHQGGGMAEGTMTPWSDLDFMFVSLNVTVIEPHERGNNTIEKVMEMETSQCRPGFTRLIVDPADPFSEGFDKLSVKHDNTMFISSQKFADLHVGLRKEKSNVPCKIYGNGPSVAVCEVQEMKAYGSPMTPGFDTVYALRCKGWPSGAEEWFTRYRLHSWPPKEVIKCIREQDCHVVPVGDPASQFTSVEWRISFLLGERELVWSFNDTQLQCYYVLKCLCKLEFDNVAPGQLSSYHMKNIMFWQCERYPDSTWVPSNLLHCVQMCLRALEKAVQEKQIDHYFDRRRNLLSTKLEKNKDREAMIEKINSLLENTINPVMRIIQEKNILNAWNRSKDLTDFIRVADARLTPEKKVVVDFKCLCKQLQTSFLEVCNFKELYPIEPFLKNMETELERRRLDPTHTDFLRRFFEMELSSLEGIKNTGSTFNAITGELYLATSLFHKRSYQSVHSIFDSFTCKRFFYAGVCCSARCLIKESQKVWKEERERCFSTKLNPFDDAAFDVVFSPRDTPIVPYVLKFETVLLRVANSPFRVYFLHPAVYFYLLMFLNETFLGKHAGESLEAFEKFIKQQDITMPIVSSRNFNLLGYCFSVIGNGILSKVSANVPKHNKRSRLSRSHSNSVSSKHNTGQYATSKPFSRYLTRQNVFLNCFFEF